jgi:transposase
MFEELQSEGYTGSYDAVRRAKRRFEAEGKPVQAYVPLRFAKGEAFQFDWSEEEILLGGMPARVYVAHFRLCHSRMRFCTASVRMSLEVVMQAHIKAHDFFNGLCGIGIYDNLKTVVKHIFKGKEREYNQRFLQLASHYLFELRACTPGSGWEKGQVENQVNVLRKRVFTPCLRFETIEELNAHLSEQMLVEARTTRHPEYPDKTVWEVFREEQEYVRRQAKPFDGYVNREQRAGMDCLVVVDGNKYSLPCAYAGQAVSVRLYADRVVFVVQGRQVAEHRRVFGKGHYRTDPVHYLPILERKPGALRNGRPFLDWELPESIRAVMEELKRFPDWDRQTAKILSVIPEYGLEEVSVACETTLEQGVVSQAIVLNHLVRLVEESPSAKISVEQEAMLLHPPRADCGRYDCLLGGTPC